MVLILPAACGPLPIQNDPAATDFFGMDPGLIRVYRSRFPICGHPHNHFMQKKVLKEMSLPGGKAALVEIQFNESNATLFHGLPRLGREVLTENGEGFGYYGLEPGEDPPSADPKRIDLEIPKPVTPGTRRKFDQGEVIVEAVEEVVVAAGRFAGCIRIRTQFEKDGNVFWFAPGIGMIRGYSESKGKDGRAAMEFELVRWSRPPR